jgi:leucyl-tRNA synthetase
MVAPGTTQDAAFELAKADSKIAAHLAGKAIKRVIFVPGRILNIVVV